MKIGRLVGSEGSESIVNVWVEQVGIYFDDAEGLKRNLTLPLQSNC